MIDTVSLGSASANAIRQYLRAAQDYGIQAEDALKATGLPLGIVDNSIARITGREFQTLIRWLVEQTQDPLFGLKSARYVQPGSYSLLGYMTMNSGSAREALELIPDYEVIVGDMGVTQVEPHGDLLAMRWVCQYDDPIVRPHMIDNVLGSWLLFARWLAELKHDKPEAVLFEYPEPDASLLPSYQEVFACPLEFNAGKSALVFTEDILETPLRQPDPLLLSQLEQQASAVIAEIQEPNPIVVQTRNLLRTIMRTDIPRREKIAEQLGMTERTLQRRLQEAGTGYQQLLDELRKEAASDWLTNTDMAINDIAYKLGFSDARSFHRRFKIWTDMTPGEFRSKKGEPNN